MIDAVFAALTQFSSPGVFGLVVLGVVVGLLFGILPGLGGITALAILIPFVYGMDPIGGLAFLLAAHAVIATGGSVTSILLGIPGSAPNAATVIDGYPLSQQGRAGYAIGAALTASAGGGLIGVIVLVLLLPILQSVVIAFGSPETFFLALMGIALIGVIGEGRPLRGLIAGGLGIFLACIGSQRVSGQARFWFDFDYLLDGFRIIPIALGLFAVPEIITMLGTGRSVAGKTVPRAGGVSRQDVWAGVVVVFRDVWLFVRSSLIGVLIGIIPGVGGETSPFVAYAAAKQASRNPDAFGRGAIEGVIAPEASNNAKEGGSLVPTMAFGIPGSSGMAVLLGGFLVLGLQPGPDFLTKHLDLAFMLAIVVAVANVIGALLMLPVIGHITYVTRIPGTILGPVLLLFIILGTYSSANNETDVLFLFVFGLLGFFMRAFGFARAALLLGFVLGATAETYFHISLASFGPYFFARPISLAIISLLALGMLIPVYRRLRRGHGR